MVCRCERGFGVNVNLFVLLFPTFHLSHFWGLNTIKVHHRGNLLSATPPPTVLYRLILNFAGHFAMICRCACGLALLAIEFSLFF